MISLASILSILACMIYMYIIYIYTYIGFLGASWYSAYNVLLSRQAKEKDGFSKLLSQRELPFDPDCTHFKIQAVRYDKVRTQTDYTNHNIGETRVIEKA